MHIVQNKKNIYWLFCILSNRPLSLYSDFKEILNDKEYANCGCLGKKKGGKIFLASVKLEHKKMNG